jgi:hypothetical protein
MAGRPRIAELPVVDGILPARPSGKRATLETPPLPGEGKGDGDDGWWVVPFVLFTQIVLFSLIITRRLTSPRNNTVRFCTGILLGSDHASVPAPVALAAPLSQPSSSLSLASAVDCGQTCCSEEAFLWRLSGSPSAPRCVLFSSFITRRFPPPRTHSVRLL